jgi:ArsR family transcriptional regulator, arsenate/arsenite/antimonite-responsive transcriptional repressor
MLLRQIASYIDICQHRSMSMQTLPVLAEAAVCCSPLVRDPVGDEQAAELARVFKALADPVRLRLLSLIGAHAGGEACVCELVDAFQLSQPTISHHLKVLREAGLIASKRRGTWVYYRVLPGALEQLSGLFSPA